MRAGFILFVGLGLFAAAPARAQYGAPFGSPGFLTSPETASGVIGAGAAHSATPQRCEPSSGGRDGLRTICRPAPPDERR